MAQPVPRSANMFDTGDEDEAITREIKSANKNDDVAAAIQPASDGAMDWSPSDSQTQAQMAQQIPTSSQDKPEDAPQHTAMTTTTRRNASGTVSSVFSGNKIRYLKKDDGQPLWRRDIQFLFLRLVFENDQKVFTKFSDGTPGQTFADIYIDAMANSSKCSQVLKEKLLSDRNAAMNMAMICLLVNVGRMNTTLNFFPEMRARVRTYHSIPCLQAQQGSQAYKQLQDGPRLKSILKGATEDSQQPGTVEDIIQKEKPRTNPVNLIFVFSQYAPKISDRHFPQSRDFFDLFTRTTLSSKSRATAFLWLVWWYLESDFSAEDSQRNPFGPGLPGEDGGIPTRVPPLESISEPEAEEENLDTPEERDYGEAKRIERESIVANDMPPAAVAPKRGQKAAITEQQYNYRFRHSPFGSSGSDSGRNSQSPPPPTVASRLNSQHEKHHKYGGSTTRTPSPQGQWDHNNPRESLHSHPRLMSNRGEMTEEEIDSEPAPKGGKMSRAEELSYYERSPATSRSGRGKGTSRGGSRGKAARSSGIGSVPDSGEKKSRRRKRDQSPTGLSTLSADNGAGRFTPAQDLGPDQPPLRPAASSPATDMYVMRSPYDSSLAVGGDIGDRDESRPSAWRSSNMHSFSVDPPRTTANGIGSDGKATHGGRRTRVAPATDASRRAQVQSLLQAQLHVQRKSAAAVKRKRGTIVDAWLKIAALPEDYDSEEENRGWGGIEPLVDGFNPDEAANISSTKDKDKDKDRDAPINVSGTTASASFAGAAANLSEGPEGVAAPGDAEAGASYKRLGRDIRHITRSIERVSIPKVSRAQFDHAAMVEHQLRKNNTLRVENWYRSEGQSGLAPSAVAGFGEETNLISSSFQGAAAGQAGGRLLKPAQGLEDVVAANAAAMGESSSRKRKLTKPRAPRGSKAAAAAAAAAAAQANGEAAPKKRGGRRKSEKTSAVAASSAATRPSPAANSAVNALGASVRADGRDDDTERDVKGEAEDEDDVMIGDGRGGQAMAASGVDKKNEADDGDVEMTS